MQKDHPQDFSFLVQQDFDTLVSSAVLFNVCCAHKSPRDLVKIQILIQTAWGRPEILTSPQVIPRATGPRTTP